MKRILALFLLISSTLTIAETNDVSASADLSPAGRSIAEARKAIEKKPTQYSGYNLLAMALARRAREISDVTFYAQAEDALKKSFNLVPGNLDGEKIHVWLLLGRHEFAAALDAAKTLNKRVPDDVLIYGFLTDANAELGNYKEAERAAQWMLDLRPGNTSGVTRAAYLRELFGDVDGAFELMDMAYQSTPPAETEDRAWILTQMAHLHIISGKTDEAEKLLQQALVLFPGYHYALGNLAKIRIQQKRYGQAVDLLQQRYKAAPHAENLYDLAEALEWAGRPDAAAKAFAEFETKSLLESVQADNSNRELIFYYADHAHQPAKALNVARQEYARRHDVYTLDAYAWSLHLNGQDAEAHRQIEAALAVGVRDARMLRHAGEIAVKLGDRGATFGHELLDFISGQLPLWRDRPDRRKETSETPLTSQLCAHLNSVARLSAGWDILQFRVEEADEQHKSRKIDLVAAPCGATICIEGRRYSDFESLMPSNARDCRYLRAETVTSANTVSVSTLRLGVFSVSKRATTAVPTRSVGCSVTYRREITSVGDPRWNGAICEVSSVA